jgi:leucyl-tRNA synthetase
MKNYDFSAIEKKWQQSWENSTYANAKDDSDKQKYYVLDMFPYPSWDWLHMWHMENYTATDIYSRFMRMKWYNVLHPMGWDAFWLPAENYAIKTWLHPQLQTPANIKTFTRQIKSLGFAYDWTKEIDTSSPEYYKWTQWFFLFLYKNWLAYKKKAKVNWCNSCQTVLANEQAEWGICERCKNEVIQKDLEQWFFKITDFAEELIDDLSLLDWPSSTMAAQKNWIGKSVWVEFDMDVVGSDEKIKVYTTRVDTVYWMTYVVISPESPLVEKLKPQITNWDKVVKYIKETGKKTEL